MVLRLVLRRAAGLAQFRLDPTALVPDGATRAGLPQRSSFPGPIPSMWPKAFNDSGRLRTIATSCLFFRSKYAGNPFLV